jgi:hypothetical protein
VYPSDRDQVVLVLEVEDFFFVHGGARVGGAFLFWEDHVGYDQFVLFLQGSSINTEKFKEQYDQRKFLRFYFFTLKDKKRLGCIMLLPKNVRWYFFGTPKFQ